MTKTFLAVAAALVAVGSAAAATPPPRVVRVSQGRVGRVVAVGGDLLTLKGGVKVRVSSRTRVWKTARIRLVDLRPGETVVVQGDRRAGVLYAKAVDVGGGPAGGPGASKIVGGSGPPSGGQGGTAPPPSGAKTRARNLTNGGAGEVESIDGSGFYLSGFDGNVVRVAVSPSTRIQHLVRGKLGDVRVGQFVLVVGKKRADGSYDAQQLTIGRPGANGTITSVGSGPPPR
jgi:Domain of unknown function (DUF5666)